MLFSGCNGQSDAARENLPKGILIPEIPAEADIIISSIRHALDYAACLDEDFQLKANFIQDAECNQVIYEQDGGLAIPRQLFTLDIESGEAAQITNMDCLFLSGQAIKRTSLMANAYCEDSNSDGKVNEQDKPNLYLLDLPAGEMECLTCGLGLSAINNPDYSPVSEKIVFSAQIEPVFHNYLFTIDLNKQLEQVSDDEEYMDFDCSWSEDGELIAFNRLPSPWLELPAQIWLMNADGSDLRKVTNGGSNPQGEGAHQRYPIGTDADADLSPDNSQIVFSRLKTGKENAPFGVWELVVIDLASGVERVLDGRYANMVPEWKEGGIIFTRQSGSEVPMEVKQALYLYVYQEGEFSALESYPQDVFPLGAFGGSWMH